MSINLISKKSLFTTESEIVTHKKEGDLYRNNLKNREFGKEALQNAPAERATIVREQGASEQADFGEKPTLPKTDSLGCFGISTLMIFIENLAKKIKEGHESSKISPTYLAKVRLLTGISCYTKLTTGRDIAIKYYLRPLILPPITISALIQPFEIFIIKESREDRGFNITIIKKTEETKHLGGRFNPSTGTIELFVSKTPNPLQILPLDKGP